MPEPAQEQAREAQQQQAREAAPAARLTKVRWGTLGLIGFIGLTVAGLIVGLFFPDSETAWKALGTCLAIMAHAAMARIVASGLRSKYPGWYVRVRLGWCALSAILVSVLIWDIGVAPFTLMGVVTILWVGMTISDPCARLQALGWSALTSRTGLAMALAFMVLGCYSALELPRFHYQRQAVFSVSVLALGFAAYAAVVLIGTGPDDRRWTIRVPARLLLGCSIVGVGLVLLGDQLPGDLALRLSLATGFVAATCLVPAGIAILTRRRASLDGSPSAGSRRARVDLICPRCRMSVEASTGTSGCPSCKTEFRIEVRSAVCLTCGYSMAGVGAVCPECGTNHAA